MKKIIALVMAVLMMATMLVACGADSGSDLEYIQKKGKLVVGITDYAPMDYKDENGNWTGFDAEFATLFAKELGVEVEFFIIADWNKKVFELDSKNIDCIWNGMTINEELLKTTNCSDPYVVNAQVVVMKADKIGAYTTVDSLKDLTVAVESGSTGEKAAKAAGITNLIATNDMAKALLEVKAGTAEACVIDITMAKTMTGDGTDYAELAVGISLTSEEYGVGFRKGSELTAMLNAFMDELIANGTLPALAQKYGLTLVE